MRTDDPPAVISGDRHTIDLIQVALLDAAGAASAGVYALSESYLYTLEALQEYLAHLKPNAWLAITRCIIE